MAPEYRYHPYPSLPVLLFLLKPTLLVQLTESTPREERLITLALLSNISRIGGRSVMHGIAKFCNLHLQQQSTCRRRLPIHTTRQIALLQSLCIVVQITKAGPLRLIGFYGHLLGGASHHRLPKCRVHSFQSFYHELTLQAHDKAIRSMEWSYDDENWISGHDGGAIKYWTSNMNNVLVNNSAHQESVRDLSFSRTNLKFCSCSDDTTIKIWDFERCEEEHRLTGHGWNVKSVDWHPTKSLLASGGKDSVVKLIKLLSFIDMRAMKELELFHGHRIEVTALAWHPIHEEYFVSGSRDGSIFHWLVGHETAQVEGPNAHNSNHNDSVWDLHWHPIGHMLCSGSNDRTTKFWCRNRPGDKSNINVNQSFGVLKSAFAGQMICNAPIPFREVPPTLALATRKEGTTIPGVGTAI
ncbi:hypothetical protein ACLB2K_006154 [Fragaria x ananassa]